MMRRATALGWVAVVLAGCAAAPPSRLGGFDSDNPASKLYAIVRAGQAADRSKVVNLVEQLENDDPLVRMMAINALERITGTRMGFNPYAPLPDRLTATQAWAQAVNEGKFGQPLADSTHSAYPDP